MYRYVFEAIMQILMRSVESAIIYIHYACIYFYAYAWVYPVLQLGSKCAYSFTL